jgi:hypothetical protein
MCVCFFAGNMPKRKCKFKCELKKESDCFTAGRNECKPNVFYNVRVLDHFWSPVVQCFATEDAGQIVNSFYYSLHPHVPTIIHNYLLRCVTFTQLTILHSYTGWILSYQLLSQIIIHFTSSHFPCLPPIETSLVEQLLNNWLLRYSSSSYITLNRTSVTVACCPGCIAATSQVRAVLRHSPKREGHVIFPYSWCVWRHRGMLCRNRISMLLRDVIACARKSCLPAGAWKRVA